MSLSDANHLREVAKVIASVSLMLLAFAKGRIYTYAEQPAPELNLHLWTTTVTLDTADYRECPTGGCLAWRGDV